MKLYYGDPLSNFAFKFELRRYNKALESKTPESAAQWLTYWVVFSIFTVFEFFVSPNIPPTPPTALFSAT